MTTPFLSSSDLNGSEAIGGKAQGLLRLEAAGLRVPPWRVLDAATAQAGTWRADAALHALFETLSQPPFAGVAVRSSAASEDGRAASFAGVYESVLVDDAADLAAAIDTVIASAQASRVTAYAGGAGTMAVIIQARVAPVIAGIAFSADPAAAQETQWYGEAVYGVGDQLADGQASPTRVWMDFATGVVVRQEAGGDGPETLEASVVATLTAALRAMEDTLDCAVDIEWAADDTGVWLLQARPVTRIQFPPPDYCATSWFFDQRFNEPIYPFTRTTLLPVIREIAIGEALAMRGAVDVPEFLFHGGQAYLPHTAYRAMLRGAPYWWLSPDLRQLVPASCSCASTKNVPSETIGYVTDALRAVAHSAGDVFLNLRRWDRFRDHVAREVEAIAADIETDWREKWAALDALSARFLQIHRWSILWADYGYRLVRRLPAPLRRRVEAGLQRAVQLVTAEANRALARAANENDAQAREALIHDYGHRSASLDYGIPTWAELLMRGQLPRVQESVTAHAPHRGWRRVCYPLVRLLELREEQRFTWERILALQRGLGLARGEALAAAGVITAPEDIWFLTKDEAWTDTPADYTDLVPARRHVRRLNLVTDRPLYIGPGAAHGPDSTAALQGLGASAGCATGIARVLTGAETFDPTRDQDTILVLRALDPAWTPVLAQVRGLVIERGGILSHASVLAREYGVPLVIGVDEATTRIGDGAEITIDGDRGTVCLGGSTPQA